MVAGSSATRVGRYVVLERIAAGGMGTVHLARQEGDAGFARTVAIKLLRPHLAELPEFVARFLDEARVASRIVHPNVVRTIDVVESDGSVSLVMEYIRGEALSALVRLAEERESPLAPPIALRIVLDTLRGLHAAHTATDEGGASLRIVHRDVSPQNVLVGLDGAAHLLDFGIATAANKVQTTREDQLKGKIRYMAPEQIVDRDASPRTDVYAAAVVLWELLARRRLFEANNEGALLAKVLEGAVLPPSHFAPVDPALDAIVLRGLAREPAARFSSAEEMAQALEAAASAPGAIATIATSSETGRWVEELAGDRIRAREGSSSMPLMPVTETPGGNRDSGSSGDSGNRGDGEGEGTVTATATEPAQPRAPTPEVVELARGPAIPAPAIPDSAPAPATPVAAGPRRRVLTLVAVSTVAILGASLVVARVSRGTTAREPAPATMPAMPSASEHPLTVTPSLTESGSPKPNALAESGATAAAPPAPRPPPSPRVHASARPRSSVDCSVPYTRDPSGIRRVKRECL